MMHGGNLILIVFPVTSIFLYQYPSANARFIYRRHHMITTNDSVAK